MAELYQVEVNNVPEDAEQYIVARFSFDDLGLWYWGSWKSEEDAKRVAKEEQGIVCYKEKTE